MREGRRERRAGVREGGREGGREGREEGEQERREGGIIKYRISGFKCDVKRLRFSK